MIFSVICKFNVYMYIYFLDNPTSDDNIAYRVKSEANLTAEVGLVVLDALSSYCVHFKDTLMAHNGDNDVMENVFSVYMTFLCIAQSSSVCGHVFATLRSFINNFSCVLFKGIKIICYR